jgi:hypothetical protein
MSVGNGDAWAGSCTVLSEVAECGSVRACLGQGAAMERRVGVKALLNHNAQFSAEERADHRCRLGRQR